jgi:iron donor protein CyaY
MLENSQFHCLADSYLDALADEIDAKDENALIDADLQQGVLTLTLPSGQQYLVSKHTPSKQIWLSSPVSGGLHFRYNEHDSAWELEDGRKLGQMLSQELGQQIGIEFRFAV